MFDLLYSLLNAYASLDLLSAIAITLFVVVALWVALTAVFVIPIGQPHKGYSRRWKEIHGDKPVYW